MGKFHFVVGFQAYTHVVQGGAPTPREAAPTPFEAAMTPGISSARTPGFNSYPSSQAPMGVAQIAESPGYFGAPTPGFGMISTNHPPEADKLRENWIVGLAILNAPVKHGYGVKITGTRASGWSGGLREDKTGFTTAVTVSASDRQNVSSYVTVKLNDTGELVDVPQKYIEPLAPEEVGSRVLVLGELHFGRKGKLVEIDQDTYFVEMDGVINSFNHGLLASYNG